MTIHCLRKPACFRRAPYPNSIGSIQTCFGWVDKVTLIPGAMLFTITCSIRPMLLYFFFLSGWSVLVGNCIFRASYFRRVSSRDLPKLQVSTNLLEYHNICIKKRLILYWRIYITYRSIMPFECVVVMFRRMHRGI